MSFMAISPKSDTTSSKSTRMEITQIIPPCHGSFCCISSALEKPGQRGPKSQYPIRRCWLPSNTILRSHRFQTNDNARSGHVCLSEAEYEWSQAGDANHVGT